MWSASSSGCDFILSPGAPHPTRHGPTLSCWKMSVYLTDCIRGKWPGWVTVYRLPLPVVLYEPPHTQARATGERAGAARCFPLSSTRVVPPPPLMPPAVLSRRGFPSLCLHGRATPAMPVSWTHLYTTFPYYSVGWALPVLGACMPMKWVIGKSC